jgi:hypothetical protein
LYREIEEVGCPLFLELLSLVFWSRLTIHSRRELTAHTVADPTVRREAVMHLISIEPPALSARRELGPNTLGVDADEA